MTRTEQFEADGERYARTSSFAPERRKVREYLTENERQRLRAMFATAAKAQGLTLEDLDPLPGRSRQ